MVFIKIFGRVKGDPPDGALDNVLALEGAEAILFDGLAHRAGGVTPRSRSFFEKFAWHRRAHFGFLLGQRNVSSG